MSRSVVTWLDFRADDLTRARDFIKAFQDDGVLDELGFLTLLARFSDVFHPATSTLMRSSRYLYFAAGIYRQLEREGVRASVVKAEARKRQDALREVLALHEREGVIGREATMDIKQLPSSVYWSGLRGLGFFLGGTSEAVYQASFDELRRSRRGYADDDKVAHAAGHIETWDPELPHAEFLDDEGRVLSGTAFPLTRAEAADLARRYRQRFGGSLTAFLLDQKLRDTPYPWECGRVPDGLRAYVDHAQRFSLFARGTTLQYYQLVIDARARAGFSSPGDIVRPVFEAWWREARPLLLSWRPEQMATLPDVVSGLRHERYPDLQFMADWLARVRAASSAEALLEDVAARRHVRDRELAVKPLKARLKHEKHLKQWDVSKVKDIAYQLDFRHPIGSRFVAEVLDGLGTK
ncbi:MAG: DUF6361 family protein [Vicinamibacterales bacterium]